MKSLGILWAQYGPYHFARVSAMCKLAIPATVRALELANRSSDYGWARTDGAREIMTLFPNAVAEHLPFTFVFRRVRRRLAELEVQVCLLPSYSPSQSFAALLAAKSLGIRTVMMNESHAGTACARGFAALVKRWLVSLFDAALVGGQPQKRHFVSLGMPEDKVFTGYDAVDNDYFACRAEEIRSQWSVVSSQYALPQHYFLSLGRFVAKKNLRTLVRAYRQYLDTSRLKQTHLVMVGSGEEEPNLRALCTELQLPIYDHSPLSTLHSPLSIQTPGVHFYGFRQIDENPVFYALADAFVLPSLYEEWGLVVNEAMACGLPVIVSETAGCAEDLLEAGSPEPVSPEDRQALDQAALTSKLRRNGLAFDPSSVDELARALVLLEAAPQLRATMGLRSRAIVEKFSCENFARNALLAANAAIGQRWVHSVEGARSRS